MDEVVVGREARTLAHIPRWPVVRTIRQQSVAEHSYYVTVLVMRFCEMYLDDEYPALAGAAIRYAIAHDVPEYLSGDVTPPAKHAYGSAGETAYRVWEHAQVEARTPWVTDALDPDLDHEIEMDVVKAVVKLCDVVEALCFLLEDRQMGNTCVEANITDLENKLTDLVLTMPGGFAEAANYFASHVVREWGHSVDKLITA